MRDERQYIGGIIVNRRWQSERRKCESSGSPMAALTVSASTEEDELGAAQGEKNGRQPEAATRLAFSARVTPKVLRKVEIW